MMTTTEDRASPTPTGCCPPFDPAPWRGRQVVWQDHPFVKTHVRSLFHIPIGMDKAIQHAQEAIDAAGVAPAQPLMLTDETSRWGQDLYIEVEGKVPDAEMASMSGTFLTQVYDGPFRDAPRWAEHMTAYVHAQGRHLERLYTAYTTCPKCAKAYGHNYVVLFAKVDPAAPRATA
jgi:hypothetical protein